MKEREIYFAPYINSESFRHKGKIIPCDDRGCETACCFGCRCCEEKTKVINELSEQLKKLKNSTRTNKEL